MLDLLKRHPLVASIVAALLALTGVGVTVELVDDDRPDQPRKRSLTVRVDGPDRDRKADDSIELAPGARAVVADPPPDVADGDTLKDETPPGSPIAAPGDNAKTSPDPDAREAFAASQEAAKETTAGSDAPLPAGPLAAQTFPGCRTAFLRTNTSSRGGARVAVVFWHYTGGPNRAGRSDVDGLTAYGNNPRAQVSWHFNIDREGFCDFNVPLELKAWTQSNANPFGVGIEVHGTGREPDYAGAGFKKLSSVTRRVAKLYGIPIRKAIVRNCQLVRSGILTHWPLGSCGGSHYDIRTCPSCREYDIDRLIARVAADAREVEPAPVAPALRRWCHHVERHRRIERAGDTRRKQRSHQRRHLRDVARRGYTCGATGPVRVKA